MFSLGHVSHTPYNAEKGILFFLRICKWTRVPWPESLRICNTFNEIVRTDGRRCTGGTVDSLRVIVYRHWSTEHLLESRLSSWEEKRRQEVKEILPKECHQLQDKHLQPCPGGEISDPQPDSVSPFVSPGQQTHHSEPPGTPHTLTFAPTKSTLSRSQPALFPNVFLECILSGPQAYVLFQTRSLFHRLLPWLPLTFLPLPSRKSGNSRKERGRDPESQ